MHFYQARSSYHKAARIQDSMQDRLIDEMIRLWGDSFDRVFEFGAGGGMLSRKLAKTLDIKEFICNDIFDFSSDFASPIKFMCFDMQDTPILKHFSYQNPHFDLIISNAAMQWMDAKILFSNITSICAKNAKIAITTFGPQNLQEITILTSLSLDYLKLDTLNEILKNLGFKILYSKDWIESISFATPLDAIRHLKLTGVNSLSPNFYIKKSMLKSLEYDFKNTLTYHPIILLAEKY